MRIFLPESILSLDEAAKFASLDPKRTVVREKGVMVLESQNDMAPLAGSRATAPKKFGNSQFKNKIFVHDFV